MARTGAGRRLAVRNFANSLSFNGSADYVLLGDNFNFERTDSFTLSAWVRRMGSTLAMIVTKQSSAGVFPGWQLRMDASGAIRFILVNTAANNALARVTTSYVLPSNEWVHVVATYAGTSAPSGMAIYANGVSQTLTTGQDNLSASILTSTQAQISGRDTTTNDWVGDITQVLLFNSALTSTQVADLYYDNTYPAAPIGEYLFTEGSGATLDDTGSTNANGTITGATWSTNSPMKTRTGAGTRTVTPTLQNLLKYSEDFSNAAWVAVVGTITKTSNVASPLAPDGTQTVDTIEWAATAGLTDCILRQYPTALPNRTTVTFSAWIQWISGATDLYVDFGDPSSGTGSPGGAFGEPIALATDGSFVRYSIELVSGKVGIFDLSPRPNSGVISPAMKIAIWGAQVTRSNQMGPYVQTVASVVNTGGIRSTV